MITNSMSLNQEKPSMISKINSLVFTTFKARFCYQTKGIQQLPKGTPILDIPTCATLTSSLDMAGKVRGKVSAMNIMLTEVIWKIFIAHKIGVI